MNAGQRGAIVFVGLVALAAFFCYFFPFVLLPSVGAAMALPVIQLPGEILIKDVPFIGNFTNTAVGMILADIVVIIIALSLRKPKMVPSGFQNFFEIMTEYLYNLTKQVVGNKNAAKVFPLVASIFLVVLVANWLELVPGVDSVGIMHCAEENMSGYPVNTDDAPFDGGVYWLKVEEGLDGGTIATEEDYHACEEKWFDITEHSDDEHPEDVPHDEPENGEPSDEEGEDGAALFGASYTSGEGDGSGGGEQAADEPHGNPDILVVTPFVRAAATDLNMTLSLALISFIAIQYYGTRELGLSYYTKFINLPALGNLGKKPMGAMDFVVGLLEIISELAKILSFGFRLFGNIFAGQVLLFVMAFLVATLLPVVFYGLELFVGLIQAFVFYMLTLVFSGMAMEGHGDDEHH